jgi:hypothetical protein
LVLILAAGAFVLLFEAGAFFFPFLGLLEKPPVRLRNLEVESLGAARYIAVR